MTFKLYFIMLISALLLVIGMKFANASEAEPIAPGFQSSWLIGESVECVCRCDEPLDSVNPASSKIFIRELEVRHHWNKDEVFGTEPLKWQRGPRIPSENESKSDDEDIIYLLSKDNKPEGYYPSPVFPGLSLLYFFSNYSVNIDVDEIVKRIYIYFHSES